MALSSGPVEGLRALQNEQVCRDKDEDEVDRRRNQICGRLVHGAACDERDEKGDGDGRRCPGKYNR